MCGITGFRAIKPGDNADTLRGAVSSMMEAIAHRGPDGNGHWIDEEAGIALGHQRLAIIDLTETGAQPMHSADDRLVLTYNGEVYNYAELRAELEPLGHRFVGTSDTEVMLAAMREWGVAEAFSRFAGMFACAVWDREEHRLTLIRDRMGVKPLYWTIMNGHVLFGSELKALMAHPAFERRLDRTNAAGFLRYSFIPNPATIFQNVYQVEPGGIVTIDGEGNVRKALYWDLRQVMSEAAANPFEGSDEEAIARLDAILRRSVKSRMVSDVPLGALLSGGIDSSTVVALMQEQSDRPIRSFSIGFEEQEFNEAPHAKAVADHLGTNHTELYLSGQNALDAISAIPDWFDEPFADPSQLPTYLVSHMARQHVTVALSGDGGDELFGGYPRYMMTEGLWNRVSRAPVPLRRAAGAFVSALPEPLLDRAAMILPRDKRPLSAGRKLHRAAALFGVDTADELHRRISEVWPHADSLLGGEGGLRFETDPTLAEEVPCFFTRMRYYDMRTYLPDDILVKVDRTSMAVALEAREPLLDHHLVRFALSLPRHFLVRGDKNKWLLRKVLEQYLPPALFERPKMGFSIPTGTWLRGPLREWAADLLDPVRIRREGTFDADEVERLWADHQAGRANRETVLWNLLMFQAWRERYFVG